MAGSGPRPWSAIWCHRAGPQPSGLPAPGHREPPCEGACWTASTRGYGHHHQTAAGPVQPPDGVEKTSVYHPGRSRQGVTTLGTGRLDDIIHSVALCARRLPVRAQAAWGRAGGRVPGAQGHGSPQGLQEGCGAEQAGEGARLWVQQQPRRPPPAPTPARAARQHPPPTPVRPTSRPRQESPRQNKREQNGDLFLNAHILFLLSGFSVFLSTF